MKKFFNDIFRATIAFYVPVLSITYLTAFGPAPGQQSSFNFLWILIRVILCIAPFVIFVRADRPSIWPTILCILIGGPIAILFGGYLGFLCALILLTLSYLVVAIGYFMKQIRKSLVKNDQ